MPEVVLMFHDWNDLQGSDEQYVQTDARSRPIGGIWERRKYQN